MFVWQADTNISIKTCSGWFPSPFWKKKECITSALFCMDFCQDTMHIDVILKGMKIIRGK